MLLGLLETRISGATIGIPSLLWEFSSCGPDGVGAKAKKQWEIAPTVMHVITYEVGESKLGLNLGKFAFLLFPMDSIWPHTPLDGMIGWRRFMSYQTSFWLR
jgi:hypothetical protein